MNARNLRENSRDRKNNQDSWKNSANKSKLGNSISKHLGIERKLRKIKDRPATVLSSVTLSLAKSEFMPQFAELHSPQLKTNSSEFFVDSDADIILVKRD